MKTKVMCSILLTFTIIIACCVSGISEDNSSTTKIQTKILPVSLAAGAIHTTSKTERTIEIQLTLGDKFEIFSQQAHKFFLPLKLELLDENLRPIKAKIQFPKSNTIRFDKELVGDYSVYCGKQKLIAKYARDQKPAHARVFYQGYSRHGY